ncbi:glycoside hydrolase family 43 protein [Flavobacteriaceae bacterium]|nr:glycoside hydrolase family 43 protein [Flavobacteriaceae bacterium]
MKIKYTTLIVTLIVIASCKSQQKTNALASGVLNDAESKFKNQPLVRDTYIADPSAHFFDGKIYIYGSHDIEEGGIPDDSGNRFDMIDYHVVSMKKITDKKAKVHPVALTVNDVPWASKKFWAPDAAYKNGTYYFYFPAKDKDDIFRIGVATSKKPDGPFTPQPSPIEGSYSIDPAVFIDDDGVSYMYFGGIWGGQLQRWESGEYDSNGSLRDLGKPNAPAILPRVAKLTDDMLQFDEPIKSIKILDENGNLLLTKDLDRRFFEAPWIHKRNGIYYLSYSTGDTHYLVYATADNPYGPFTYKGILNYPVQGWTNHHSIIEIDKKWYLFYHDTQISNKTHLRNLKLTELVHNEDNTITPIRTMNE